jgi:hypothetical protein
MFTFPFCELSDYEFKGLYMENDDTEWEEYAYVFHDGCWYSYR